MRKREVTQVPSPLSVGHKPLHGSSPCALYRNATTETPLKKPTLHLSFDVPRIHCTWWFSKFLKLSQLRATSGFKDGLPNKMR